jgi:hypothetical protein
MKFRRHHLRVRIDTSDIFDEHSFYAAFTRDLQAIEKQLVIESPFLTVKRTKSLLADFKKLTNRGVEVKIYTRLPEHQTAHMEAEANQAIQLLRSVNVRVFLCADLRHRKLAILDKTTLWEGSLNILSQSHSCELMRRTVSERLCHDIFKITRLDKQSW